MRTRCIGVDGDDEKVMAQAKLLGRGGSGVSSFDASGTAADRGVVKYLRNVWGQECACRSKRRRAKGKSHYVETKTRVLSEAAQRGDSQGKS